MHLTGSARTRCPSPTAATQREPAPHGEPPVELALADSSFENDADPLSAEDTELLQALMNAGHADRVEFIG